MAKVGIVMGSDSDMPVMAKAADILEKLGIDYEMTIISAHREPDVFFEYAKSAEAKGFKVIIAGAGMAAHLPGMCAAIFPMPVIGIPMHTTSLGGRDSLYSIVQMPSGIPVATVAINGGANAGLLAAKILATSDDAILQKLKEYSKELKEQVIMLYAGRNAEALLTESNGEEEGVTTGASNDIEKATDIIKKMIVEYGMNDEFGLLNLDNLDVKPEVITKEAVKLAKAFQEQSLILMKENIDRLRDIAEELMKKETLTGEEIRKIAER